MSSLLTVNGYDVRKKPLAGNQIIKVSDGQQPYLFLFYHVLFRYGVRVHLLPGREMFHGHARKKQGKAPSRDPSPRTKGSCSERDDDYFFGLR